MKEDNTDKTIRDTLDAYTMIPGDLSFDTVHKNYLRQKKQRQRRRILIWLFEFGLLAGLIPAGYSLMSPNASSLSDKQPLNSKTVTTQKRETIYSIQTGTLAENRPSIGDDKNINGLSASENNKIKTQETRIPESINSSTINSVVSTEHNPLHQKDITKATETITRPERHNSKTPNTISENTASKKRASSSKHKKQNAGTTDIAVDARNQQSNGQKPFSDKGITTSGRSKDERSLPDPIANTDKPNNQKNTDQPSPDNITKSESDEKSITHSKTEHVQNTTDKTEIRDSIKEALIKNPPFLSTHSAENLLPALDSSLAKKPNAIHTSATNTAVSSSSLIPGNDPPQNYHLSISPEVSWNIFSTRLSANSGGNAGLIEAQSATPKRSFSGKIMVNYNYKNAAVSTGLGYFNIENSVNSNSLATIENIYRTDFNHSSSVTSSVVSITRVVLPASWDTISPPSVSTRTALSTATLTTIDTIETLAGKRVYVIVNGDTIDPKIYNTQVRFLTIPLQLSYCFNIPGSRLGIEPQAGIQLGIPLKSYQLTQQDNTFRYSKQKLPFKNNFMLFDAGLKINYRLRQNLVLYFKQGYLLSRKTIYKNDYPLKYSFSSIYSSFGLSFYIK